MHNFICFRRGFVICDTNLGGGWSVAPPIIGKLRKREMSINPRHGDSLRPCPVYDLRHRSISSERVVIRNPPQMMTLRTEQFDRHSQMLRLVYDLTQTSELLGSVLVSRSNKYDHEIRLCKREVRTTCSITVGP
jgi:hypothetical protein